MTDQPLSYDQASELDSLQGILSQLTGWAATEAHKAEQAGPDRDADAVTRLQADRDRYAQLLRSVHQLHPTEVQRLLEELAPVARRIVESSR